MRECCACAGARTLNTPLPPCCSRRLGGGVCHPQGRRPQRAQAQVCQEAVRCGRRRRVCARAVCGGGAGRLPAHATAAAGVAHTQLPHHAAATDVLHVCAGGGAFFQPTRCGLAAAQLLQVQAPARYAALGLDDEHALQPLEAYTPGPPGMPGACVLATGCGCVRACQQRRACQNPFSTAQGSSLALLFTLHSAAAVPLLFTPQSAAAVRCAFLSLQARSRLRCWCRRRQRSSWMVSC